ncbi:bifunctional anthranilate synthase component I family protein/class IV aminotransferase [Helicobacter labetoulli]|uniref:chorismate-binding protein n=1 Tax=Helicobacter labetoulli TaxID=2315333 RepID=UPI000EF693C1|nr:bifunctional anthranilate synthase component I family protein/class IV aminotransferase [Helicobacter labetoulli]
MKAVYGDYSYTHCVRKIYAFDINGVLQGLQILDAFINTKQKGYFVGYMTYEAGVLLQAHLASAYSALSATAYKDKKQPLLYFALYHKRKKIKLKQSQEKFPLSIACGLRQKSYEKDFLAIKENIKNGHTYQLNYTQEILLHSTIPSKQLFKHLALNQNTPYKAYISNAFLKVLCFSPELFFKIKNNIITTQPMKGTIKRALHDENLSIKEQKAKDKALKLTLQRDSKNRSENLMIVDLLRNDLSKVIMPDSLQVKELCVIHSYPSVHQMVSTIKGRLKNNFLLSHIFQALFPCGSITGAPKLKTMEIISRLESHPRGVYCGALGLITHKEVSFCVPIRTLSKIHTEKVYRYGVGSGVVWDSVCEDEFAELNLKSKFLNAKTQQYDLFETMLYKNGCVFLLDAHMKRLQSSALTLGFNIEQLTKLTSSLNTPKTNGLKLAHFNDFLLQYKDLPYAKNEMWQDLGRLRELLKMELAGECILRLVLWHNGSLEIESLPLLPVSNQRVTLSPKALDSTHLLTSHKTTHRPHFAIAQKMIERGEVFDMIFYNQKGEITEGSRSNIVCEIDGRFYTPHSQSGLLQGTLRNVLLHYGLIAQKKLTIKHLKKADRIFCLNSVRGVVQVNLQPF